MRPDCSRPVALLAAVMTLLLAGVAQSQPQEAAPRVYRCGDSYGTTPCPGGKPVAVDDSRSDDQRRQAQAVKDQEARLAADLAAERRARERASMGQQAARLGPSESERARAEAQAKRAKDRHEPLEPGAKKKKPKRTPRAPGAA